MITNLRVDLHSSSNGWLENSGWNTISNLAVSGGQGVTCHVSRVTRRLRDTLHCNVRTAAGPTHHLSEAREVSPNCSDTLRNDLEIGLWSGLRCAAAACVVKWWNDETVKHFNFNLKLIVSDKLLSPQRTRCSRGQWTWKLVYQKILETPYLSMCSDHRQSGGTLTCPIK